MSSPLKASIKLGGILIRHVPHYLHYPVEWIGMLLSGVAWLSEALVYGDKQTVSYPSLRAVSSC